MAMHKVLRPLTFGCSHIVKPFLINRAARASTTRMLFSTLQVTTPCDFVKLVELNRPEKRNAMNTAFWNEMIECFRQLSTDPDCRVVVLSGSGKLFTAGLDLQDNEAMMNIMQDMDVARKGFMIKKLVKIMQDSFNVIEECPKPVIAAVHNGCLGAGIDMISACDIRYCTQDAWFQIKEIDLGIAADLGTLQRFPKIVGNESLNRELTFTARKFLSDEAKSIGFVSRTFLSKEDMMTGALDVAKIIASKSPVAVQGSKVNLVKSRDCSVAEGLEYQLTWNSAMLQSQDVVKAVVAGMNKEEPVFDKV